MVCEPLNMKKLIILFLLFILMVWLFIKPAIPTYTEVTGNVVDFNSNLPIADANVEIFRFFNDGGLWVLLRYGYLTETKNVKTNSSGQFQSPKIIKDSRMGKKLWTGDIRVSKEGYIPFHQQIFDSLPTAPNIQLQKQYSGQILPQGNINLSDHVSQNKNNLIYINFQQNGLVESPDQADLTLHYEYEEAKNFNDLPKLSQYLGTIGGRYLAEIDVQGGIALVEARQNDLFSFFEEVEHCSDQKFTNKIGHPGPSVYCVKTKDGKFAKIVLRPYFGLDWIYQPNGTDDLRSEIKDKLRK